MPKYLKQNLKKKNKASGKSEMSPALAKVRKRIIWQAGLALSTIVLTMVIIFAMTAAWESNVVQTNGLQFHAEAWGFDGDISVGEDAIEASPGDVGIVTLNVENTNQDVASIFVNASKVQMTSAYASQMQKRLFLYVDTPMSRNDETMDRVYINSQDSYVYTLLGGQSLTLTDTIYNAARLKWHWVYDVLGYYVLGMSVSEGESVSVQEYLRPIEYDYDSANTVFEMKAGVPGKLLSVNGQTADEFMVELSKADGYKGTIDPAQKLKSGYYPVDVDEDGYGIYAYLCNYGEIAQATQFDTMLGELSKKNELQELFTMVLNVSAQSDMVQVTEVGSLDALQEAITNGVGGVIRLTDNIKITDTGLVVGSGQQATVDLAGYTITNTAATKIISVEENASLTLLNGSIVGKGGSSAESAVHAVGAEVMMSNVNVSNAYYGVYVEDNAGALGTDSKVHLLDCEMTTTNRTVYVKGNGDSSNTLTQVVIEGCTLKSTSIHGVCGDDAAWGTDIQVLNSSITSATRIGIYHPQRDSSLMVYKSEVTGHTGITIKGGTVSVVNSRIVGNGTKRSAATPGDYTGNGILVKNASTPYEIRLTISEQSVITSEETTSLQVYPTSAEKVTIRIQSGIFDEAQPDEYIDKDSVQNGSEVTPKE